MKKCLVIGIFTVSAMFAVSAADEAAKTDKPAAAPVNQDRPSMMPGMAQRAKPEMIDAQVIKVYSAEKDGAKFKAYVVAWEGSEVVVTDPMGTSDKKAGDSIKVAVMRMEMPGRPKMIRFMLAEGMPMMKAPGTKEPSPKTPEAPAENATAK